METDRVHVLVVAYGYAAELDVALQALEDRFPVTVVDNSSSQEVQDVAARRGVGYIDPGTNNGFASGVNVGLRHLRASPPTSVLLLNPDAVIRAHDLDTLAACLSKAPDLAAISPRLVEAGKPDQRVVWPFPSPWRAWLDAVGLGRIFSNLGPTFVIGAVVLLRWEVIEEVGLFDERFFLYCEETDWQRRAARHGWRSDICADSVATHAGAGSSDNGQRREALFHAGHETYIRKWYGGGGWFAYRVAAGLGAVLRSLVLRGERRTLAQRRALLYMRGPRRCAGLVVE
jgi:GT2 family glycosyltransferase